MDDLRLREIEQELQEYVVTDAIEALLIAFLERYAETRTGQTDRVGVWVSGFFGSGKSHFVKLLSYLLENRQVGAQHAVEIFKTRIAGSPRQREIEGLLHRVTHFIATEAIAFQIKTEEELVISNLQTRGISREQIQANHISTILYRQWLKHRGFSTTLWVGRLEQQVSALGHYDAFVQHAEAEGRPWHKARQHEILARHAAVRGMCAAMPAQYPTPDAASQAIDDIQTDLRMGPAILARELAQWVDAQKPAGGERAPHLLFVIDEIGQFVGESNQKLLELQSIVEAFGTHGKGKLWLVVTAQEALEEVVQEALRREYEFNKIRDRFDLRLGLTSENIETVLEERILKKKESQRPTLAALYQRASGHIATISTLQGAARPLPQPDARRFIRDYPFPPYQLAVLQEVFAAVRTRGDPKEKIEGTERSLIGVTQAILKSPATGFAASPVGRLVAFDEVYDQIEAELPSIDRRTINQVQGEDAAFLKRVLKVLYLIQKLAWIPCTAGNLARLLVTHVDGAAGDAPSFSALQQRVREALERLEAGHYIVAHGERYEFLSGVKKDIELDIAAVKVTINDLRRAVKQHLRQVLDLGRVRYQGIRWFDIEIRGDDEGLHSKGDITAQIYSPLYVEATDLTRDKVLARSYDDARTLYWFPAPEGALRRMLTKRIQTEAVVSRRRGRQDTSVEERDVLRQKERDMETGRQKLELLLRQSLLNGTVIYNGEVRELAGRTTQLNTVFNREIARIIPFVYTRFEPAAVRVAEASIDKLLTARDPQLREIEPELALFDDAYRLNRHAPVVLEVLEELRRRIRAGEPCDGRALSDYFEAVPYGWDPTLVRVVLAAMFRAGVVSVRYEGRVYTDYKVSRAQAALTGVRDFRRTDFIYDPQEGVTPQERRRAQQAIDRLFHRRVPDTVNLMAQALEEELTALQQQNKEQRILARQADLPLKPLLAEGQALIETLLAQPQADRRLKALLTHEEALLALRDYQVKVQTFSEAGHVAEYRRARALMAAARRGQQVTPAMTEAEAQTALTEMQAVIDHGEIVEAWHTFVQHMAALRQRYQAAYEDLHARRHAAYAQVRAELEAMGIATDALDARLCAGPVGWSLEGLTCTSCETGLETLYYQIQSAPQEKVRLVEEHARAQEAETAKAAKARAEKAPPSEAEAPVPQPEATAPAATAAPAFAVVRLYDAVQTRDITTAEDLDAAVAEFRAAVQEALDAGKRVVLA
jgi:hypothetical protein